MVKTDKSEIEMIETPKKGKETDGEVVEKKELTLTEKLKKEEDELEEIKKKSMNAWAEEGEKKSFGITGMMKFTLPRLWRGGCFRKFMVIVNAFMIISNKVTMVIVPLILREVIDAIVCDDSKPEDVKKTNFIKVNDN